MARISNRKWGELQEALKHNKQALVQDIRVPFTDDDIKVMAYDAMFEATSAWCVAFGVNLRDAVYCEWWTTAKKMLAAKKGDAKERMFFIIRLLENLKK